MQAQEWRNLVRYCVSGISKEEVLRHSFSLDALKRSNVIAKKVLPFLREKLEEMYVVLARVWQLVLNDLLHSFMGEQPEMAEYVASGLVSLTHPLPPNTSLSTDCMGFIKLLTRYAKMFCFSCPLHICSFKTGSWTKTSLRRWGCGCSA